MAVLVLAAAFGAPFAASYYYKKGAQAYLQNNFPAAKRNLNTSLIFDSKNYRAYFLFGKIALGPPAPKTDNYYPQADYKEAVKYYEKAVSLGLEQKNKNLYGILLEDLGGAYWNLKDFDKARGKYLEKLSKFPESSFWARYFIALDDFNRLNKPNEAIPILLPALNLAVSNNDQWNVFRIHSLLARFYIFLKDNANTEKYALLAIKNGGENNNDANIQTAYDLLAVVYGQRGDFAKAEQEIKEADGLAGMNGKNICSLALAYYAGKNYSKAIKIAKAQNLQSGSYASSICLQALAYSFLDSGNKQEAKKYLEEYISFTENFPQKNIFVVHNRKQFADELLKLK